MLRKLKWQLPGEHLADRYNWCQGTVQGRGPAVEKHWSRQTQMTKLVVVVCNFANTPENRLLWVSSILFWRKYMTLRYTLPLDFLHNPVHKAQLSEAHCDSVLRCLLFSLERVTRSCWANWLIMTVYNGTSTGIFPDTDHLRKETKPASETSSLNCTLDNCFINSSPQNNAWRYARNRGIYTGLVKMIVGVLTTCHTQYTSDSSICIFLI
jgi:hypothetical protein